MQSLESLLVLVLGTTQFRPAPLSLCVHVGTRADARPAARDRTEQREGEVQDSRLGLVRGRGSGAGATAAAAVLGQRLGFHALVARRFGSCALLVWLYIVVSACCVVIV